MFTLFKNTGEFVCIHHGPEEQIIENLADDVLYVEGAYPSHEYDFSSGVPVKVESNDYFDEVRIHRNSLLAGSDWTQMVDSPLTDSQKAEWASYRQALRDITQSDPVVWPTPPVL